MTKAKPSEGEWAVGSDARFVVSSRRDGGPLRAVAQALVCCGLTEAGHLHKSLAKADEIDVEEAKANARLIAKAPKLLAALEQVVNSNCKPHPSALGCGKITRYYLDVPKESMDEWRALIKAAAEG